jgi:hypothetical protein
VPLRDYKCKHCSFIYESYSSAYNACDPVSCKKCGSIDTFVYFGNHRLNFNGFGRSKQIDGSELTTAEIDAKCKAEGMHYLSQEDQARVTKKYRAQADAEDKRDTEKKVEKEMKALQERGVFSA